MDEIQGTVAAGFEAVRGELAAAVAAEGDALSAQLVAYRDGERVVDLWTGTDITADTLLGIYSASKGVAHLVVALLVQDGVLDLDRPVCHYWPEFAVAGKERLLLRELLAHRAGLVGADTGFTVEELADDRVVAERLGAQRPYWAPGTAFGYHALVAAALSGEVVRRATGATVAEHFAARIAEPYAVDLYFGLPEDQEPRFREALPMRVTPERAAALAARATGPNGLTGIAFNRHHPGNRDVWELPNIPVIRTKGPASLGAVASARGLARAYAAAISPVDGPANGPATGPVDGPAHGAVTGAAPLLNPATVAAIGQIQSAGHDLVTREFKAYTVGFHATSEVYPVVGQGAFGHSGAGGAQSFADPRNGIAYAYNRRRAPFPAGPGPENDRLIRALYAAAGR